MIETTVVIPNWNGIKYLKSCLESLCACEKQGDGEMPFAIIVVDNGSTDGSVELVKEAFPFIKLICFEENKGFCGAVNAGILASETPYVILLNNDTTVADFFVSNLTKAAKENARYFSVSAKLVSMKEPQIVDDAGDFYCALGWAFARGKGKASSKYEKSDNIFAACGGAVIYRKDILEEIGLFDENHFAYLEDIDIGYRARIRGYRNRFEPSALVYHAGSATTGSRYNEFKVKLAAQNSIYLIWKNMPILQIVCNLPLLCIGFMIKYLFFIKKGFGKTYASGIREGFRLSFSENGKMNKQTFRFCNLPHYLWIEIELLYNILRRIFDF